MKLGVIFDLDGTLLDTLEDLKDAVNYTLNHFGLPQRSLKEIRTIVGNGVRNLIANSMTGTEKDPSVDDALAIYLPYYQAHNQDKTKPYEGVMEALAVLGEKYPIAVVSNKQDTAVKPLCAEHFPGVYALGEVAGFPRKPQPDMVHKAMKELGVDGCIYVGDSEVDIVTANNSGVPCLSVLWGFRDEDVLAEAGGKYFCKNVADMPAMIDQIIGEVYGQ